MIRTRRTRLVALTLSLALVVLACQHKETPVPDRVFLAGDSTLWLTNFYGGGFPLENWEHHFDFGWRASDTQPELDAAVGDPARSPQVVVMMYGHNYVRTGMSPADRAELERHLTAVHDDACTVLVMPAYTGSDVRHRLVIAAYRLWVQEKVTQRPTHRVAVDLQTTADQHAESFADGVHFYDTEVGAAFTVRVRSGVDECLARTEGAS